MKGQRLLDGRLDALPGGGDADGLQADGRGEIFRDNAGNDIVKALFLDLPEQPLHLGDMVKGIEMEGEAQQLGQTPVSLNDRRRAQNGEGLPQGVGQLEGAQNIVGGDLHADHRGDGGAAQQVGGKGPGDDDVKFFAGIDLSVLDGALIDAGGEIHVDLGILTGDPLRQLAELRIWGDGQDADLVQKITGLSTRNAASVRDGCGASQIKNGQNIPGGFQS